MNRYPLFAIFPLALFWCDDRLVLSYLAATLVATVLGSNWLLGGDSPGVAISGDSGCGKTSTINLLLAKLARSGQPFLYIDPTGNSARFLERVVADLPARIRQNFVVIRPCDLTSVVSINPLHVPRDNCSDVEWMARVTTKVAHVVRILLAAWGETDLHGKPRLFTWLYRIIKTLASCGLTIPDCRYFLDPRDELYLSIVRAVQDPLARRAFEDLAGRRPTEADEQLESTRTRLLGFACESQAIELLLGRSDEQVLKMHQAILEGKTIIVSLELGGTLRDDDQAILANLILTDFLFAVQNMPAELRRLYVVCLDELPIFANNGSGPLLMRSVREVRQFLVRYVWAFQGMNAFDDPRFINLALSQLGGLVAMRHTGVEDAKFIGGHLALSGYSAKKVKQTTMHEVQYQRGHDLKTLIDQAESWSTAEQEGSAEAFGTSEQTNETETTSRTETDTRTTHPVDFRRVNDAVAQARARTNGSALGRSSGTKTTSTRNQSTTVSRGGSRTFKQSLVPRLVSEFVTTGIQFYTPEEHVLQNAAALAGLPTGHAAVYLSGHGVYYVRFPLIEDPFLLTPKFAAKKLLAFQQELRALPYYRSPQQILDQREKLLLATIEELDRLSAKPALIVEPVTNTPRVPPQAYKPTDYEGDF